MADNKITVTWDDLKSRKVDSRLKEQEALARTRDYARMDEGALPTAGFSAHQPLLIRLWHNAIFVMALFGFVGGMLAWVCGASVQFKPTEEARSRQTMKTLYQYADMHDHGKLSDAQYQLARDNLVAAARNTNPYFAVRTATSMADDPYLTAEDRQLLPFEAGETLQANQQRTLDHQKEISILRRSEHDRLKGIIANILSYGVSGVVIAIFLAVAAPASDHNLPGIVINGSVGAGLGLVGGILISLFVDHLKSYMGAEVDGEINDMHQMLARAVTWGSLGLFLAAAPGIVMRNPKKLAIGLFGGLLGGVIGGIAYDPVVLYTAKTWVADMVAMTAIGLFTGLATGIIENVAKTGWVKVTAGVIAGKQFILYRNPTFLGSGPDCQIYLFRDPQIGRRHAAIHIVKGGFELEDLPLGSSTVVNGKPVQRARLRNGDRIQIGSTALVFMERTPAA